MFKMFKAEGRVYPRAYCDKCGKPIEDGSQAGVVYMLDSASDGSGTAIVVHKGACMDAAEEDCGDKYDGWVELAHYLSLLAHNMKLTPARLADEIEANKQFG